jgi:hypothetical protein
MLAAPVRRRRRKAPSCSAATEKDWGQAVADGDGNLDLVFAAGHPDALTPEQYSVAGAQIGIRRTRRRPARRAGWPAEPTAQAVRNPDAPSAAPERGGERRRSDLTPRSGAALCTGLSRRLTPRAMIFRSSGACLARSAGTTGSFLRRALMYVDRGGAIRIISARPATRRERRNYEESNQ